MKTIRNLDWKAAKKGRPLSTASGAWVIWMRALNNFLTIVGAVALAAWFGNQLRPLAFVASLLWLALIFAVLYIREVTRESPASHPPRSSADHKEQSPVFTFSHVQDDVISALVNLGYAERDARRAAVGVFELGPETFEALFSRSIQDLNRRAVTPKMA